MQDQLKNVQLQAAGGQAVAAILGNGSIVKRARLDSVVTAVRCENS